jgi:hypothetical protein
MSDQRVGRGFWIQAVLSAITLMMAAVTLIWPDWIELMFGADPDAGSGAAEWAGVGAFLCVSVALAASGWRGWQRSAKTVPSS